MYVFQHMFLRNQPPGGVLKAYGWVTGMVVALDAAAQAARAAGHGPCQEGVGKQANKKQTFVKSLGKPRILLGKPRILIGNSI